ncbi:MAG TPA: RimK family alpha-L-glutamate ligase [Verrucomicrobia bacterium]|nr:RimK family alpha-L-glutamate ligase [Verrucomicrobiota bacterium]
MNGWILYGGKDVVELTRACDEARRAGVNLEVIAPKDVDIVLDAAAPAEIYRQGIAVPAPQFAIAGFVDESDDYNLALLQQLEAQGVLCVNRASTLRKTSDKLLTLQLLAAQGIPVPKTLLIRPGVTTPAFIREHLGLPVVVKVNDGSKGYGVALVQSETELDTLMEMLAVSQGTRSFLAQEFVADSRGRDLRVLVIDGQPRVCMLRSNRAPEGFKSNVSAGGRAEAFPLTDPIRELSIRVIQTLELNMGGIDLLFKGGGFLVGEANSIPGFQGIEYCHDINVPGEMLKSIGRQLKERAAARYKAMAERFHSLEDLKDRHETELVPWFLMGACGAVKDIQQAVLLDIVRRNANTAFGRAHGFEAIRSVEDFRQRVAIGEWKAFEPYALRMEQGEKDLLFDGQPSHFISTSGTTGKNKLLPESADGHLAKALVSRIRTALLMHALPKDIDGYFIPFSNVSVMDATASGIPVDYASGSTLGSIPDALRRRMAIPMEVLQVHDPATQNYLVMRFALAQPLVRLLIANNPRRMTALMEQADSQRDSLISDMEAGTLTADLKLDADLRTRLANQLTPNPARASELRAMLAARGRLDPRDYWPKLGYISCWLGGSVGRYLEGLKAWLPDGMMFMDCGYGASEGKFNIPSTPGTSAGPLAVFGYFLEFIPESGGDPLLAHELKDGTEYRLVVTSYSGLYRYDLHDIVRVAGFTRQNPNILFVSKTSEYVNIGSEKLSGTVLSDLISGTLAAKGLGWMHFCVVENLEHSRYDYCIEPEGGKVPDVEWLVEMEQALMEQSEFYRILRNQCVIRSPRLFVMKRGWLENLYHAAGGHNQVKLPVIWRQAPAPESVDHVVES